MKYLSIVLLLFNITIQAQCKFNQQRNITIRLHGTILQSIAKQMPAACFNVENETQVTFYNKFYPYNQTRYEYAVIRKNKSIIVLVWKATWNPNNL